MKNERMDKAQNANFLFRITLFIRAKIQHEKLFGSCIRTLAVILVSDFHLQPMSASGRARNPFSARWNSKTFNSISKLSQLSQQLWVSW